MIHSLAGGSFKEKRVFDFAKVELMEGIQKGDFLWYIVDNPLIAEGDEVFVPVGRANQKTKARVVRIDKKRVEGMTPVPINIAKRILGKVN